MNKDDSGVDKPIPDERPGEESDNSGEIGRGLADLWDVEATESLSQAVEGLRVSVPDGFKVALPKIDLIGESARRAIAASLSPALENFAKTLQATVAAAMPKIDYAAVMPKLDYSEMFPGIDAAFTQIRASMEPFLAGQREQFREFARALAETAARLFPENWRGGDPVSWEDAMAICLDDGIPLAGVPRRATLDALLAAETSIERRAIVSRRWKGILNDCEAILTAIDEQDLHGHVRFTRKAVAALRDGHAEAAQALLASLIDTMLRKHLAKDLFRKVTDNRKHKPPIDVDDFTIRVALVVAPIWAAYAEFWEHNGDPIPTTFARHASAHAVSKRQFTRVNAVIALMVTTSFLWLLDRDGKSGP